MSYDVRQPNALRCAPAALDSSFALCSAAGNARAPALAAAACAEARHAALRVRPAIARARHSQLRPTHGRTSSRIGAPSPASAAARAVGSRGGARWLPAARRRRPKTRRRTVASQPEPTRCARRIVASAAAQRPRSTMRARACAGRACARAPVVGLKRAQCDAGARERARRFDVAALPPRARSMRERAGSRAAGKCYAPRRCGERARAAAPSGRRRTARPPRSCPACSNS